MSPGLAVGVACAGALGTLARYGVNLAAPPAPGRWPWATLAVNLIGALLIGVVVAVFEARGADSRWRVVITTGFLGASASSNEAGYITHKVVRSLGALAFDNQARV